MPSGAYDTIGITSDDEIQLRDFPPIKFHGLTVSQEIEKEAVMIANSIVKSSINQLCLVNNKTLTPPEEQPQSMAISQNAYVGCLRNILLTPGQHISFPLLLKKGFFQKPVNGESGKNLASSVKRELQKTNLGDISTFTNPGNKTQVTFFSKMMPPAEDVSDELLAFVTRLNALGVSLPAYSEAFNPLKPADIEESERHKEDFDTRRSQHCSTPTKRPRID